MIGSKSPPSMGVLSCAPVAGRKGGVLFLIDRLTNNATSLQSHVSKGPSQQQANLHLVISGRTSFPRGNGIFGGDNSADIATTEGGEKLQTLYRGRDVPPVALCGVSLTACTGRFQGAEQNTRSGKKCCRL